MTPDKLADDPLFLINLAKDGPTALNQDPYSAVPRAFLDQGHRAASFDLPELPQTYLSL